MTPSVANFLSQLQIVPCEAGAVQGAQRARAVLLEDVKGTLLAVVPANELLDLEALNRLTGRALRALSPKDSRALCAHHGLDNVVALPGLFGVQAVVDESLLALPVVQLADSFGLAQADFARLMQSAQTGRFCLPLPAPAAAEARDVDDISNAVRNFTALRIRQRLEETLELPPLPMTAQEIIKLRAKPDAEIAELAAVVDLDPALASQVVSWAASPYYCAPGKIKSVFDAIQRVLGFDLVLNLALGLSLGKTLRLPKDQTQGLTPYWHQAVYTASLAQLLAQAIPAQRRPTPGLAYLCGLLHNFGYLVLAEVFPPQFTSICREQEANPHLGPVPVERHLLGVTRDQVGGWLMRMWNMPDEICVALRHQRDPSYQGEEARYANLLFLAAQLLREKGIGDAPAQAIPDALWDRLGLTHEAAEAAVEKLLAGLDALEVMASSLAK